MDFCVNDTSSILIRSPDHRSQLTASDQFMRLFSLWINSMVEITKKFEFNVWWIPTSKFFFSKTEIPFNCPDELFQNTDFIHSTHPFHFDSTHPFHFDRAHLFLFQRILLPQTIKILSLFHLQCLSYFENTQLSFIPPIQLLARYKQSILTLFSTQLKNPVALVFTYLCGIVHLISWS